MTSTDPDPDRFFLTKTTVPGTPTGELFFHGGRHHRVMAVTTDPSLKFIMWFRYNDLTPRWFRMYLPEDWIMWPVDEWAPFLVSPHDNFTTDHHHNEHFWDGGRYLKVYQRPDQSRYYRWTSPDFPPSCTYHHDLPADWVYDSLAHWVIDEAPLKDFAGRETAICFYFDEADQYCTIYLGYYDEPYFEWFSPDRSRHFCRPAPPDTIALLITIEHY